MTTFVHDLPGKMRSDPLLQTALGPH
jgi:hypothetical protein